MTIIFSLEKAKDLYDEVFDEDNSTLKCEASNELIYIIKSLMGLAIIMESIDDAEFVNHVKMIIKEAIEENGFGDFR